jgi:hypothetical protein
MSNVVKGLIGVLVAPLSIALLIFVLEGGWPTLRARVFERQLIQGAALAYFEELQRGGAITGQDAQRRVNVSRALASGRAHYDKAFRRLGGNAAEDLNEDEHAKRYAADPVNWYKLAVKAANVEAETAEAHIVGDFIVRRAVTGCTEGEGSFKLVRHDPGDGKAIWRVTEFPAQRPCSADARALSWREADERTAGNPDFSDAELPSWAQGMTQWIQPIGVEGPYFHKWGPEQTLDAGHPSPDDDHSHWIGGSTASETALTYQMPGPVRILRIRIRNGERDSEWDAGPVTEATLVADGDRRLGLRLPDDPGQVWIACDLGATSALTLRVDAHAGARATLKGVEFWGIPAWQAAEFAPPPLPPAALEPNRGDTGTWTTSCSSGAAGNGLEL